MAWDPEDWPDEIQEIWQNSTGYGGWLTADEMAEFQEDGADLFHTGWIDDTADSDARQEARDHFFDLMAQFDLDAELFDWDSWRDWYESA